jgi:hypothetical protein
MQLSSIQKKIHAFYSLFLSTYQANRSFALLAIFLLFVLLVSFIIPFLHFGRFFGTDDYFHLFHTNQMASSRGIEEFYEHIGADIDDPSSDTNPFNYPFGLWLFGATIAKITGLPPITADLFFVIIFLFILVGSFYLYSSAWLESGEQKIFAVLFLISMPQISLSLLSYRPSIFILPFLFITLYFVFKGPANWKLLPIIWLSLFILVISHTGTTLFLISFLITFFLLYCLLWGEFSKQTYSIIISTFVIYVIALTLFPQIKYQYEVKSRLFLLPGEYLASKFNFSFLLDLTKVFYDNVMVDQQFIYAIIIVLFLFVIAKFFIYLHRKTASFLSKRESFSAIVLPIQNLSHSIAAAPLWIGPVQVIFSVFGIFHLDNKGKCLLVTTLFTAFIPELLQASQGTSGFTGALREISYLVIIIPITATLGFWHILNFLNNPLTQIKKWILTSLWIVLCVIIIITPILGTTYYLPTISGEDFTISGMKWLGVNGDNNEIVAGYKLQPVPIYTNMTDAVYNLQSGTETRQFLNSLTNIYFGVGDQVRQVNTFRQNFGVRYILNSDKITRIFGNTPENLTIDSNPALTKIYASNDFGIYEVSTFQDNPVQKGFLTDTISYQQKGGTYEIDSGYYKVTLSEKNPLIKRFGTPQKNLPGGGLISENFRISGTDLNPDGDVFNLEDIEFTHEIRNNQITYTAVLANPQNLAPESTLRVRYTFYPNVIKRELMLSNDWLVAQYSPQMNVQYSIRIFSPMSQFVVKNEDTRLDRHIYASEDTVTKNMNIEDFFLHDDENGMYIRFAAQSPHPSSIFYGGSIYNKSTIGIVQSATLKPGASLFSTQFLSLGDEYSAEKNIQNIDGIKLINYPDGIYPILIAGYRTPQSDWNINANILNGYSVLNDNAIPYAEAINPTIQIENSMNVQNISPTGILSINLKVLSNNNITIIGSQRTGAPYFDDYSTQEKNIMILSDYTKQQDFSYSGFMPESFNYNLDTLTILSGNKIPFIFSHQVKPTPNEYRAPQMAYFHSESSGPVLFPVSSPASNSLSSTPRKEDIFSSWKTTIDTATNNDEMVLFLLRSQDIGDPVFTEDFIKLFSYAREKNMTFSSPVRISEHFTQIQNIHFSGSIDEDEASINVTNTNHEAVRNVTFKVTLPELTRGNYQTNDGEIVRNIHENGQSILYVSIGIPADTTKNIIIGPDTPRKVFQVTFPQQPVIEGSNLIIVKDEAGNPLRGVDVLVDSVYSKTDSTGTVHVDLRRGNHTVTIQTQGYKKFKSFVNVKGRIYFIEQLIGRPF